MRKKEQKQERKEESFVRGEAVPVVPCGSSSGLTPLKFVPCLVHFEAIGVSSYLKLNY